MEEATHILTTLTLTQTKETIMKIDSSSLKEDVEAQLARTRPDISGLSEDDVILLERFVSAAVEIGTRVDHEKIETEEDLKICTSQICKRVTVALKVVTGGIKM